MKVWKAISVAGVAALALGAAVFTTTPSPASAGTATAWEAAVDCDTVTAGVQGACNVTAPTTLTVAIVATNNSGPNARLGSFQFDIFTDETLADPTGAPVVGTGITGTWNCGLSTSADVDPSPSVAQARLVCFNGAGDGPIVNTGISIVLGTVQYSIPGAGSILFDIGEGEGVVVSDEFQAPLGECPEIIILMNCSDATVTAGGAAVNTATPTNTATNTPVPTATCVGAACPTETSVAFATVTPTPGPETPTAVPTSPPGTEPTQPGGQVPPGGEGPGPGGQPGGGGAGPITLPDTGTNSSDGASAWTWVMVALATAVAAGGAAGGVYYRRLQSQRGTAQGEE